MAGTNKVFKENDILFKSGDAADAMYIVRKGALKVYLQKGGEEVTLAILKDGAIVGEMAFFDDKPRSASVKAASGTECTVITKADFEKLLKQIPPWFVAMMKSLSGRLRQTNERLTQLEASAGGAAAGGTTGGGQIRANQEYPFQHVLRCLNLVMLAFARDGVKDNPKELMVDIDVPRRLWGEFFGEGDRALFDEIIASTVKTGFISLKGAPKPTTIVFVNRGGLAHFMQFFTELSKKLTPAKPFLSPASIALFEAAIEAATASGYPSIAVNVGDLMAKGKAKNVPTIAQWPEAAIELCGVIPELKGTGTGTATNIKVVLKEHKLSLQYVKFIKLFFDSSLA